jgi:hypothetical protein
MIRKREADCSVSGPFPMAVGVLAVLDFWILDFIILAVLG